MIVYFNPGITVIFAAGLALSGIYFQLAARQRAAAGVDPALQPQARTVS